MIILFENILVLKESLACNGCFGLFTKFKKGSGTSFWYTFSAIFFHKNAPYLMLYQWKMFECHTFFPSQDIKQNVKVTSKFKGYLCYKTIFCNKVALNAQLIFFIWRRNVLFSRYLDFCVFVKSIDFKIYDIIISIATWWSGSSLETVEPHP